ARLRSAEAVTGEHVHPVLGEHQVHQLLAELGVLEGEDRVGVHHLGGIRRHHGRQLVRPRGHVGGVDQGGVHLTGGHPFGGSGDVLLQADRLAVEPGEVEQLGGGSTAGHLGGAGDERGVGQVRQTGEAQRVAAGDRDHQRVRGEQPRLVVLVREGGHEVVHRGGVRGGQHVGVRPFGQLGDQGGGSVVDGGLDGHVRVVLGEHVQQVVHRSGQGGGGEHGQRLVGAAVARWVARRVVGARVTGGASTARCGQRERSGAEKDGGAAAAHRASTITVVALTTALARAPTSSPRSRTASADIRDTTR